MTSVVALAGGVGGAKLAWGLTRVLSNEELTVVVNTGDDFEHFGLSISPDLDTVCYTLAGLANPQTGWGREGETWNCLTELKKLDAPDWFNIGDRDLALHLERTRLLREGMSLSDVTAHLCRKMGVMHPVYPMSNQAVRTIVSTREYGDLPFQEYFVKHQCQPTMMGVRFESIESAGLPDEVFQAVASAEIVVICPSNPWVSIDPILGVGNFRELVKEKVTVAVSPIIGGQTVKGPAAKMYREMGIEPSALAVARHYGGLLKGIVIDIIDKSQMNSISQCGIIPLVTQTLMSDNRTREELARETVSFAEKIKKV